MMGSSSATNNKENIDKYLSVSNNNFTKDLYKVSIFYIINSLIYHSLINSIF